MITRVIAIALALSATLASSTFADEGRMSIDQSIIPMIITNPGSYIVTQNVTGVAGTYGIVLVVGDVTLDLNGFVIAGVPGSLDGILVFGNHQNVNIRNGSVRDWGGDGVDALGCRNARMTDILSAGNGGDGIRAQQGSVIEKCAANSNGLSGITARNGTIVRDSVASFNNQQGIDVTNGCLVADCSIYANGANGIRAGQGCQIVGNICTTNGSSIAGSRSGIVIFGAGSLIKNNLVTGSNRGIEVNGTKNIVVENAAALNADDYLITAANMAGSEVNLQTNLQKAANSLLNLAQ